MFLGREYEITQLRAFFEKPVAGLAVCCGRRRVGKSTLIEYAAQNKVFLEFYGLPPRENLTNKHQLNHFSGQLAKHFQIPKPVFKDWQEALDMLAALTRTGSYIVFLDEVSWMTEKDKDFPGKLKGVWDTQFKKNPKFKLILCGSVSSWIQKNILKNKGFVGRVSLTIELEELPLADANKFWKDNPYVSSTEKFKLLCVTGGIPRYLEEVSFNQSAETNIKELCFTKGGLLLNEFEKIFEDLFGKHADSFQAIISTVLNKPKSHEEICESLGVTTSGNISEKINILKECGFLARDYVWREGKQAKKLSKYRLKDNYLRFYLKYIKDKKELVNQNLYRDINLESFSDWHSIMGLQFENLVLSNLPVIQKLLNIAPETLLSAAPYFQNTTQRIKGCQIDLLIQTKLTFFICEIKFKNKIGLNVINEVMEKIQRLKTPKTVTLRPILIYQGELSKNVINQNFFSKIICFDELLK